MAKLTEIIKEDLRVVGQLSRGIFRGVIQGIYTPALMTTGIRQFVNELDSNRSNVEISAKSLTQIVSSLGIYIPLTMYAIQQGRGKEYFGALIVTNLIDYIVDDTIRMVNSFGGQDMGD